MIASWSFHALNHYKMLITIRFIQDTTMRSVREFKFTFVANVTKVCAICYKSPNQNIFTGRSGSCFQVYHGPFTNSQICCRSRDINETRMNIFISFLHNFLQCNYRTTVIFLYVLPPHKHI